MMLMQRVIMRLEQGAAGLAGLEALLPRRNAAQTHNCLCPKDLCGTVASATVALQTSFISEFEIGSRKTVRFHKRSFWLSTTDLKGDQSV